MRTKSEITLAEWSEASQSLYLCDSSGREAVLYGYTARACRNTLEETNDVETEDHLIDRWVELEFKQGRYEVAHHRVDEQWRNPNEDAEAGCL